MTAVAESLSKVGEPVVLQYAKSLVTKTSGQVSPQVLLLRAQPVWDGPTQMLVTVNLGEVITVEVRVCESPLAIRDAMLERDPSKYLVVLTNCADSDLGLGILSRVYNQRVVTPSMLEAVKGSFAAREVDSSLTSLGWVDEPLVLLAPSGGWPVAPAGVLTRDHALSHLTARLLGGEISELDPSSILNWTLSPTSTALFREQPKQVREGIIAWVSEVVGPVAALALRSVMQGRLIDALTIGLVADVLWGDYPATPEVIAARTRLEKFTGVINIDPVVARSLADSARGAAQRMDAQRDPGFPGLLDRATALFSDVEFTEGASRSTLLRAGFDARVKALAEAIRGYLTGVPGSIHTVEPAFEELLRHDQAGQDQATNVARMAVRLTRWLATAPGPKPTDLHQAVLRQARENAFVDWAAADVWVGSTSPDIASVWSDLFSAVRVRRDLTDREFATLLADATQRGVLPENLVLVESAVVQLIKPLVQKDAGVLVILVDGMSTAVAAELTEEAMKSGWYEAVPEADGARTAVLAALPTLTKFSRTSFFTGSLQEGAQTQEKSGFARLTGGQLFHKGELSGVAGQALPNSVLTAISSDAGMCAVVLNTVDDALSKANPGGTDWTIHGVQHLAPLLEEAGRAGRTVFLISDHGHVIERGGLPNSIAGAEARWRTPSSGPLDPSREIVLTGKRVLADGGSIIAAVDESLRYANKQAGYHGGASAAEVVIPVIVLSRTPDQLLPAGWIPATPQSPPWWNDPVAMGEIPVVVVTRPKKQAPAADQGTLEIDIPVVDSSVGTATNNALVDLLLKSPIYQAQKKRQGTRAVPDDRMAAIISVLLTQSGRVHQDTLAASAGIPTFRLLPTLGAVRRQLNLEGYTVFSTDVDNVTIILDADLLRQQFLEGVGE